MIIERKPSWFYLKQREISLLWNGAGWNEPLFLLFLPSTQMIDIGVVLFPPVFISLVVVGCCRRSSALPSNYDGAATVYIIRSRRRRREFVLRDLWVRWMIRWLRGYLSLAKGDVPRVCIYIYMYSVYCN